MFTTKYMKNQPKPVKQRVKRYEDGGPVASSTADGESDDTVEIAEKLNRKRSTISMFVSRHAKELGIEKRMHLCYGGRPKSTKLLSFDKQWQGSIPRGHWMITKPWGNA